MNFVIVMLSITFCFLGQAQDLKDSKAVDTPMLDSDSDDASDDDAVPMEDVAPIAPSEASGPVGVPQVESAPVEPLQPEQEPVDMIQSEETSSTKSIIEARRARRKERQVESMFGSYRVHLGVNRPTLENNRSVYKKLYKDEEIMPTIGVDYFAWDWFVTMGLAFRMGYYNDTGRALKIENGQSVRDPDGKIKMTWVPLQAAVSMQMTPFTGKWLVLSGWAGLEYLYYEESREEGETAGTDDSASGDQGLFLTKGWRSGQVLGAAASIRIDWADGQASGSMSVFNLRHMYLSPYMEVVRSASSEKLNFERTALGLLFTFESIN